MSGSLSIAFRNCDHVFARRAPRSGARNLAGAGVSAKRATPGEPDRQIPARRRRRARKLAVTMTGGIARCARSTPGYIPCTAPRCPPREYVIVIRKRQKSEIRPTCNFTQLRVCRAEHYRWSSPTTLHAARSPSPKQESQSSQKRQDNRRRRRKNAHQNCRCH